MTVTPSIRFASRLPQDPNVMDVDATHRWGPNPVVCYQCGKTGHTRPNCPEVFDVHTMTVEGCADFIQCELATFGCLHDRHRTIRRGWRSCTREDDCWVRFYILQWVNSTPLLHSMNHFASLFLNENLEYNLSYSLELKNDFSAIHLDLNTPSPHLRCILKWERWLPKHYILAATPSERLFNLDIAIQTTYTSEVHTVSALLNLGATGLFIDPEFMWLNHLTMQLLARAIPVYNVDGTPNEQRAIRNVIDVVLWYQDHTEWAQFAVTGLCKSQMILGHSWLRLWALVVMRGLLF